MAGTNTIIVGASASRIQEELDRLRAQGVDMNTVSVGNNPIGGGSTTVPLATYQATGGKEYGNQTLTTTNKPTPGQAKPISQADYQVRQGETPAQYNDRIALLRGDTAAYLASIQSLTASALGNPVNPPVSGVSTPTTPTPTAGNISSEYFDSLTQTLANQRASYENAIAQQKADFQKQMADSQAKIDNFTQLQQEGVLTNVEKLTQPFRQTLEDAQRQSLYVNKNFEDNQKLVNELDSLLTQGNELIAQQKGVTGLGSIRNPRIQKTMDDVAARAGVIQAVMSARNGQIAQAYNMIDRTVQAITADRQDQIDYFKTLYNFYESQKDDEGRKLIALTSEQRKYIDAQINILGDDLKRAQDNAENLKNAMIDPETALIYAQAGITLNDSVEQRAKKLADWGHSKEIWDMSNAKAKEGYSALPIAGVTPTQTIDSRGVVKNWYKIPGTKDSSNSYSIADSIITANPNMNYMELRNKLLRETELGVTEIDALLASRGKTAAGEKTQVYMMDSDMQEVADAIIQKYGVQAEQSIQATGTVVGPDGKDVKLSTEQLSAISRIIRDKLAYTQAKNNLPWYNPASWF